jgi:hypothetical protein
MVKKKDEGWICLACNAELKTWEKCKEHHETVHPTDTRLNADMFFQSGKGD